MSARTWTPAFIYQVVRSSADEPTQWIVTNGEDEPEMMLNGAPCPRLALHDKLFDLQEQGFVVKRVEWPESIIDVRGVGCMRYATVSRDAANV